MKKFFSDESGYIDINTGMLIVQLTIAAGFGGLVFLLKTFWSKIVEKFKRHK